MKPKIFVDSIGSLENVYHELIPISQHMGVKVRNYTGSELTLVAPLANNGWMQFNGRYVVSLRNL